MARPRARAPRPARSRARHDRSARPAPHSGRGGVVRRRSLAGPARAGARGPRARRGDRRSGRSEPRPDPRSEPETPTSPRPRLAPRRAGSALLLAAGVIGGHQPAAYPARALAGADPALLRTALLGVPVAVARAGLAVAITRAGVAVAGITVSGLGLTVTVSRLAIAVAGLGLAIAVSRVAVAIAIARFLGRPLRVALVTIIAAERQQSAHHQHLEQFMRVHVSLPRPVWRTATARKISIFIR